MADAANAFVGECGFDGTRKANPGRPRRTQFRWCNGRDTLNVLPNSLGRSVNSDFTCDRASGGWRCEARFEGSEEEGEKGNAGQSPVGGFAETAPDASDEAANAG